MRLERTLQSGDTIIEVLLATVVISVVVAGAFTLTNRATRLNQTAIERTTVTNIMSEQIEQIRGIRTSGYGKAAWTEILNKTTNVRPQFVEGVCSPTGGSRPFYIDRTPNYDNAGTILTYSAGNDPDPADLYEVWVEAYNPNSTTPYIDFHVRACWEGIGETPLQRSGLVLRLAK